MIEEGLDCNTVNKLISLSLKPLVKNKFWHIIENELF